MFSLGNTLTEENHAAHEILKHPASRHAKIRGEQIKPKGGNKSRGGGANQGGGANEVSPW